MTRNSPDPPTRLSTKRLVELAEVIADDKYAVGPQDERDIIEALRELVDRRNAERIIAEAIGDRSAA